MTKPVPIRAIRVIRGFGTAGFRLMVTFVWDSAGLSTR